MSNGVVLTDYYISGLLFNQKRKRRLSTVWQILKFQRG